MFFFFQLQRDGSQRKIHPQAELHRQTGIPKSTISEVLSGKKSFSKTLIRTLASFFKVDASVLASNL